MRKKKQRGRWRGIRVGEIIEIEFKNVSYSYEGSSVPILKNLSLKLGKGKKVALVGLNGAGKTTMVKILCGFLEPTEGEILVNGIKRKNISKESYREMITCMFQDSTLLPISLDENITNSVREEMKKEKLLYALEASGFLEKYEKLAEKGDSLLIREVHDKAVEFSGGEKQKLLFARALYKDSPVMI